MSKTCTRLLLLGLVGVLVLAGAFGTATAAAKIKGNQIAVGAIATKHLKAGAVTGDKIAAGAVTGPKVATGSLTGAGLAANTVTGAQVDETTLGRVPDAATLKGTAIDPITLDLPNTLVDPVVVASGPGWSVAVDCETAVTRLLVSRSSSAAMLLLDLTVDGGPQGLTVMKSNVSFSFDLVMFKSRVTVVTNGSATTQVDLAGFFAAGQFGSQKDCYYRGAVTRWP